MEPLQDASNANASQPANQEPSSASEVAGGSPSEADAVETTAMYLAKATCAQKGFEPVVPPEALVLHDYFDIVLTKSDGLSFQVICVVDGERKAPRKALPADLFLELGRTLAKYTGCMNGAKLPVGFHLWQVGPGVMLADMAPWARRMPGLAKVVVTAWAMNTTTQQVSCSAPFNGRWHGRPFYEGLLQGPRSVTALESMPVPMFAYAQRRPWLSVAMLALLAMIFVAELKFGLGATTKALAPSLATLVAFGGLNQTLVNQGDWWRFFTAPLLHGDALHLLFNGVALYIAAATLERLVSRAWLVALFGISALGGSLLSYLINPDSVVSVGASGAVMGLLAAAFLISMRVPLSGERAVLQMRLMQFLVPSLIPLATHRAAGRIDFAAHLGGAIAGGLAAWLLLRLWPKQADAPGGRRLATGLAAATVVGAMLGAGYAYAGRGTYVRELACNHARLAEARALFAKIRSEAPGTELPALRDGDQINPEALADVRQRVHAVTAEAEATPLKALAAATAAACAKP